MRNFHRIQDTMENKGPQVLLLWKLNVICNFLKLVTGFNRRLSGTQIAKKKCVNGIQNANYHFSSDKYEMFSRVVSYSSFYSFRYKFLLSNRMFYSFLYLWDISCLISYIVNPPLMLDVGITWMHLRSYHYTKCTHICQNIHKCKALEVKSILIIP